ncbi:PEGA domain-containing protein [Sorangium sp. So ce1097]|uniref:PEGA domain-containing protein n=1 Tax=Sorangium sp. So ce1097 TaxID=3133330 RepID=UPI003F6301EB
MFRVAAVRNFPRMFRVAAVLLLLQAPALAQDADELKRARAQFQQATELEQAGNWAAALQQFREVGQVRMTPQVRFHIAVCEENLGRLVAALGGYELALAEADAVGPDFRAEVEQSIGRLRARIPKLVIVRGKGAASAAVALDGVALGGTSIGVEVPLDPGPHALTAKAPNHRPFQQTVELKEGGVTRVEVTLEALPQELLIQAGALQEKPPSKVVPYVIGGVGAASLIGSGVLFALRQGALQEMEDACGPGGRSCPPSMQSRYDDLKFYHYGAQVALGVGVAAVGTATAILLLQRKTPKEPAKTSLELVPVAGATEMGARLSGAF